MQRPGRQSPGSLTPGPPPVSSLASSPCPPLPAARFSRGAWEKALPPYPGACLPARSPKGSRRGSRSVPRGPECRAHWSLCSDKGGKLSVRRPQRPAWAQRAPGPAEVSCCPPVWAEAPECGAPPTHPGLWSSLFMGQNGVRITGLLYAPSWASPRGKGPQWGPAGGFLGTSRSSLPQPSSPPGQGNCGKCKPHASGSFILNSIQ